METCAWPFSVGLYSDNSPIAKWGSNMELRNLMSILRKSGCSLKRHGSNHDLWMSPFSIGQFPVPRHRMVKRNLARKIFKQAGLVKPENI